MEINIIIDSEDGKRHKPKLIAKEMLIVERRFILNHTHTQTAVNHMSHKKCTTGYPTMP